MAAKWGNLSLSTVRMKDWRDAPDKWTPPTTSEIASPLRNSEIDLCVGQTKSLWNKTRWVQLCGLCKCFGTAADMGAQSTTADQKWKKEDVWRHSFLWESSFIPGSPTRFNSVVSSSGVRHQLCPSVCSKWGGFEMEGFAPISFSEYCCL